MVQLQVLSGAAAGKKHQASIFPISVGRAADCTLALNDPGVFERHFEIHFSPEGFTLAPGSNAVVMLNGARTERALLHNGDIIEAGLAKLQFWLGALPQRALALRETLTWLFIAAVVASQVYLVFRLLAMTRS